MILSSCWEQDFSAIFTKVPIRPSSLLRITFIILSFGELVVVKCFGVSVSLHAMCHCSIGYFCISFFNWRYSYIFFFIGNTAVLRKVFSDLSEMLDCLLSSVLMIVLDSTSLVKSSKYLSLNFAQWNF